jgi:hypothetical protein
MIAELLIRLDRLSKLIRQNRAVNVNSRSIKEAAIDAGSYYFGSCREDAVRLLNNPDLVASMDEDWQYLIRLAHGNNPKKTYLSLIRRLLKKLKDLTVASHSFVSSDSISQPTGLDYSDAEKILVSTLENLVPTAALSYSQGLQDLNSAGGRLSYRGTACEFREALRETLDYLAPDKDVTTQPWFKVQPNCSGPTMKQKVRFVLSSRGKNKTQRSAAEKAIDLIENLYGEVARAVYSRASVSTHVQTTKEEVAALKRYLDAVLFDLLEIGQHE